MAYDSEKTVIQNLKDAGCSQDTIQQFMECLKEGTVNGQLRILSRHRRMLLDKMHDEQKRIDCLDYLVYQIQKNQTAG